MRCDVAGSPEHCAARYDGAGVSRARVPRARARTRIACDACSRRADSARRILDHFTVPVADGKAQRAGHAVAPCAVPLNTPRVSVCQ